jgi:hypothetical protein
MMKVPVAAGAAVKGAGSEVTTKRKVRAAGESVASAATTRIMDRAAGRSAASAEASA